MANSIEPLVASLNAAGNFGKVMEVLLFIRENIVNQQVVICLVKPRERFVRIYFERNEAFSFALDKIFQIIDLVINKGYAAEYGDK